MELSSHPCQAIINNRVLLRSNDGSVWTGFSTDVHTDGRVCTLGHSRWAAGHCEGQTPTRWWQSWTDRRGIVFPFGNWVTMKVAHSCPTLWDPSPWGSPGQNTGVGSLSFPQGIFPTQGLNPGLLHCRWILYQLSHKGSPRILEWVAFPFSMGSSRPRNRTGVSYIAGRFFTSWTAREALSN